MKRLLIALSTTLLLAACGGTAATPSPTLAPPSPTPTPTPTPSPTPVPTTELHTLTGTFTLDQDDTVDKPAGDCRGTGGYSDIRSGNDVLVKDETGTIIGTGRTEVETAGVRRCVYAFEVIGLPEAKFYDVTVGRREGPTWSLADMESMNWHIALTIGP